MKTPTQIDMSQFPTSEQFTSNFGAMMWLLTMSKEHHRLDVSELEDRFVSPLALKQVRLFKKDKLPIAFLTWCYADKQVAAKIANGAKSLSLEQWRSGKDVVLVECVSPFANAKNFTEKFKSDIRSLNPNIQ